MTAQNDKARVSEDRMATAPQQQNWSLMVGVAVITLGVLVMVVNLLVYETKANILPATSGATLPLWVQVGRAAGLLGSPGIGAWLLWRLLSRRRSSDQSYLKTHLPKAISYIQKIELLLQASPNGHERQLLAQIQTWWQTIEAMAQALANLGQNDDIIQSDLIHLPGLIANLEEQLRLESNPLLRTDLEQMLTQRQNQQQALEQLQTTRRRAEIQIERTIAVLGTIYSQLLTFRSTFQVVDYQHLADSVANEVEHLQDYLEALQEVKGSRLPR